MLALYPQVPSPLLLSLSVWAVASGLEGESANSSGESREEGAAERTRAPGSVRSWDLTARQKRGRQRLLPRTPTIAAQRLGSPKRAEEGKPACLSSFSGGLRPLVELCVEPAGLCGRCQGIFPTQGLNPGLLHCRQILYHLSHQGGINKPTAKKNSVKLSFLSLKKEI